MIISPLESPLTVSVGGHLPIYCVATGGDPVPYVQWYNESLPVYPELLQLYQQIYLVPTHFPHTTAYTCQATQYYDYFGFPGLLNTNATVTVVVEGMYMY